MTHINLRAMIGARPPSGIPVVHHAPMPTFRRFPRTIASPPHQNGWPRRSVPAYRATRYPPPTHSREDLTPRDTACSLDLTRSPRWVADVAVGSFPCLPSGLWRDHVYASSYRASLARRAHRAPAARTRLRPLRFRHRRPAVPRHDRRRTRPHQALGRLRRQLFGPACAPNPREGPLRQILGSSAAVGARASLAPPVAASRGGPRAVAPDARTNVRTGPIPTEEMTAGVGALGPRSERPATRARSSAGPTASSEVRSGWH